jgi:hypothetical protein
VLNAVRDDDKLACFDPPVAITKLHQQPPFDDQKQLVFVSVVVPDEFPLDFGELDVGVVEFAHDARTPVLLNEAEFLGQVDHVGHVFVPHRMGHE